MKNNKIIKCHVSQVQALRFIDPYFFIVFFNYLEQTFKIKITKTTKISKVRNI